MRTYLLICTTKRKCIIMTIMFLHSLWYNCHTITKVLERKWMKIVQDSYILLLPPAPGRHIIYAMYKTSVPRQSNRRSIWWTDGTVQDHRQAATHRWRYTALPMWLIQHTYIAFLGVVFLNRPLEFTPFSLFKTIAKLLHTDDDTPLRQCDSFNTLAMRFFK